ncbi:MAG: sulfate transporter [Bacteroidetes bacterium GWD2_45_23]|nr:MAG: sulfate transporter [Bacteroidetes bacterium GWC2_46_850]OFX80121.1 MAG: sulfate transporter [Bacteroidetes bacterium GWC1_47_7]OFX85236.1 MAG: sulfate transporter [Bacteroidetes bacterium GWD2_45_23]HAR37440.1 putative sulfate exporter family transporter [Porphyromonadaceae bacterium]HBB00895.1 putative sulfate exporter family transporter [Porphyromonadaceae bacterium]
MLKSLKSEDWVATLIGAVILLLVILMPVIMKDYVYMSVVVAVLAYLGYLFMGNKDNGRFLLSFAAVYLLAWLATYIAGLAPVKTIGLESVFFAVIIGLLIRNTVGLPKWLAPAVKSEYYIKAGLVILGSSILFNEIMRAGALGMVQAVIVVLSVWYFSFWISNRAFGIDKEMSILLSSAVSICGVSAAIATSGAIKGDPKKLSFVISLVLIVAIPMMYLLPYLAIWMGLSEEVAGAWLGGTIDTTAAVVASGKFIGETAEQYSVIIKSAQNVLLGVAAFVISIYWSYKGTNNDIRPSGSVLWDRFPKFVIGFLVASLVFSFAFDAETGKALSGVANKGARGLLFSLAFVCIGLETDFRYIFKKENAKYIWSFLTAQTFNILLTLLIAWLLFRTL